MLYFALIIAPLMLGMWASNQVSSTYKKWSKVPSCSCISGAETATLIIQNAGIVGVKIIKTSGYLSDYYDPIKKYLALSSQNYHGTSLAAIGIAAHEAAHAVQHQEQYVPSRVRSLFTPIAYISSRILPLVVVGGFFFGIVGLVKLSIIIYFSLMIIQIITLPVEFNASSRAKSLLFDLDIVNQSERQGISCMLNVAAITYVATLITSLTSLAYFILLSEDRNK